MKFEKGVSGNPNGRPKGTKNKLSRSVKEELTGLFTRRFRKLANEMDKLPVKDQFDILCRLLPYIAPRLQVSDNNINLSSLSDEQLEATIENLKNELL